MKFLSLFTGIGGFEAGINQAYVAMYNRKKNGKSKGSAASNAKKRAGLVATSGEDARASDGRNRKLPDGGNDQGTPVSVGYSEIDPYAIQVFNKHFPNHNNYGDITKIKAEELPNFDFLCGGFPCQSFSIAGKRGGFEDTRGTLFFDIARILKAKKPQYLLLENVKGLLSHDGGKTFRTIIATLAELGYDCQWQVCNSKNFGVPQNRERIFIVGYIRGTARPQVFPIGEDGEQNNKTDREDRKYNAEKNPVAPTLRASDHKRGDNQTVVLEDFYPGRVREFSGCPTLRSGRAGLKIRQNRRVRRLTPTECERLQGFPDGWTKDVSDTQRYKMLGNAVTVNVIQAIMEKLCQPKE